MSTFVETLTETFHVISCYSCSLRFAIPNQLYRRVVTEAVGDVYCPTCGKQSCWRESEDQKRIKELQRKLEWEASECARQKNLRDAAEASLKSTRGVVTKMKRRVSAGVCPCCQRTFKQLSAHMATKHPDFAEAAK